MMDFWSNHFSSKDTKKESTASDVPKSTTDQVQQPISKFRVRPCKPAVPFQDRHPFLKRELSQPKSRKSQALLADFRARGATIRKPVVEATTHGNVRKEEEHKQESAPVTKDSDKIRGHDEEFIKLFLGSQLQIIEGEVMSSVTGRVKFPVLYSNYSTAQTKAESNFCVYPSSIVMELSGTNCLTLGSFLENYCFRSDYKCPNNECKSSQITDHIRKFCYSNGSVCLTLRPFDTEEPNASKELEPKNNPESVMMSSTFCDICKFRTGLVPVTEDFMSMSFAKFLMLRICGQEYNKNVPTVPVDLDSEKTGCSHESFLRHSQYFKHKNLIAAFEYHPITVRSIFLPQIDIRVTISLKKLREEACEELKKVSVRGWELHGAVHDRVTNLRDELQGMTTSQASGDNRAGQIVQMIQDMVVQEEKDRNEWKKSVEQIQVDLCSKNQGIELTYQVMNSIFFLKKQIVTFIELWNARLSELNGKKRSTKSSHGSNASLSRPDSVKHVPSLAQSVIPETGTKAEVDSLDASTDDPFNRSDCSIKSEVDIVFQSTEELVDKVSITASERSGDDLSGIKPMLGDDGLNTSTDNGSSDALTDESYAVYRTLTEADKHMLDEIDSKRTAEIAAMVKKSKAAASSKTSLSRIIEQFRPGTFVQEFETPFENEHYNLSVNEDLPVLVRDDDAGSMIAFTLASHELDYQLKLLGHPGLPRSASEVSGTGQVPSDVYTDTSYDSQVSVTTSGVTYVKDRANDPSNDGSIEVQFEDSSIKFYCTVYFAERFRKLRSSVIKLDVDTPPGESVSGHPSTEEMFIRSLSTAFEWKAAGGKSGSRFRKTLDNRFIIKEMNTQEVQSFKQIAKKYFDYIEDAVRAGRPTALAKVLGVFKVTYKNIATGSTTKMYVLVIENLFYGRNITQKFDLKGSARNRLANLDQKKVAKNGTDEVVLLDTNLVQLIRDSPLYVRPEEKRSLQGAIDNDSSFLTSLDLLDYSLLVGVDEDNGELVVGIIDYIRSYTWDKKLESAVKSSISGKEPPTIVKPELYKERFLNRMNQYFLPIPDSESKIDLLESSSTVIVL